MTADTSRRSFLSGLGTGALGLTFGRTDAAMVAQATPPATRERVDRERGVDLAIATICLDGFGDENFEPAFRLIPRIGLQYVEFNVWHPRTVTPAGLEGIGRRCEEHGLVPICLQGTAFGGNAVKDVTHKLWLMARARQLGCRRVKFTGARRGAEGGLDQVIATLRELAPAAEQMDVLVLVENHANNNIENLADYERIFGEIQSRHVGMCLDMGHFDGASVSNFDVIDRFHDRVLHIDLKDTLAFGTYRTVNYGSGITDVHGIVRRMLDHGYTGYLVIEQAPPLNPGTLLEDMIRARQLFERYVRG